jgi:serine-type D-Ala-D-Ala carboxypeptidase
LIDVRPLVELCEAEIGERGFPGAAFAVGNAKETAFGTAGRFTYEPGATKIAPDSIFDMASVTKVMATTAAAMLLFDDGRLDLDRPVASYLPAFVGKDKEAATPRNLLLHDSGLPAYATLTGYESPEEARMAALKLPLKANPGERTEYS